MDENETFNGICSQMEDCDVLLCIEGNETYPRPHVDCEIHTALKGGVENRKGIVAVMLENRNDSKNAINYNTFPTKLQKNLNYIVLEQYASIGDKIEQAIEIAIENRDDGSIQVTHINSVMQLRAGKYYDN